MQTKIEVLNDAGDQVRAVTVVVESADGISTAAAVEDASALVKNLVNKWIHCEGVHIKIISFKTDGNKDD